MTADAPHAAAQLAGTTLTLSQPGGFKGFLLPASAGAFSSPSAGAQLCSGGTWAAARTACSVNGVGHSDATVKNAVNASYTVPAAGTLVTFKA